MDKTPPGSLALDEVPDESEGPRSGRPTMLTPKVRRVILAALARGALRETAAQLAGISPRTLVRWMAAAAEPWASFAVEVQAVEARAEMSAVDLVLKAAKKDPRWAAWWLERRHPDGWARRPLPPPTDPAEGFHHEMAQAARQVAARLGAEPFPRALDPEASEAGAWTEPSEE